MFKVGDVVTMVRVDEQWCGPATVSFVGKRVMRIDGWAERYSPVTGRQLQLLGRWPSFGETGITLVTKSVRPKVAKKFYS